MKISLTNFFNATQKGRYATVVAFLLGLFIAVVMLMVPLAPTEVVAPSTGETSAKSGAAASTSLEVLAAAPPTRLSIPALNLTAEFEEPLGVQENGEIEVPESFEKLGWYQYGPAPGELGPAVILGHVDSYEGPAIFWTLGQLEPGDEVEIEREDGEVVVYEITRLERFEQSGFPTALVYGDIDHAGLRLITCSGTYDQGSQRYSHNLVVFGKLKTEYSSPAAAQN